jgi:hypothetical protein
MNLPPSIRGALKSLTVWFSMALAAAPDALPLLQQNFSVVAPYIPTQHQAEVLRVIALVILLLRIRTTASLAAKGTPK